MSIFLRCGCFLKAKITKRQYKSLDEFGADCEQMFLNAQTYNLKKSIVYQDSLILQVQYYYIETNRGRCNFERSNIICCMTYEYRCFFIGIGQKKSRGSNYQTKINNCHSDWEKHRTCEKYILAAKFKLSCQCTIMQMDSFLFCFNFQTKLQSFSRQQNQTMQGQQETFFRIILTLMLTAYGIQITTGTNLRGLLYIVQLITVTYRFRVY